MGGVQDGGEGVNEPHYSSHAYLEAKRFIDELNEHRRKLPKKDYLTLRRIALSGNVDTATKMLAEAVKRRMG